MGEQVVLVAGGEVALADRSLGRRGFLDHPATERAVRAIEVQRRAVERRDRHSAGRDVVRRDPRRQAPRHLAHRHERDQPAGLLGEELGGEEGAVGAGADGAADADGAVQVAERLHPPTHHVVAGDVVADRQRGEPRVVAVGDRERRA